MEDQLAPSTVEAMKQVFGEASEPPAETTTEEASVTTKETPSTVEDKAKTEDKPKDERAASRILAAKKAESRAAKQRAEIEAERAAVEKQRAELAPLLELAESLKGAKDSPAKLLELAKLDPKSFIEKLASEHDPSSEAKREIAKTQTETEKLRAEVEALRKEREEELKAAKQREVDDLTRAAQSTFIDFVAKSHERYPHLVEELTPEEIADEALRVATRYATAYKEETGEDFTDDVLADYLESQAKARAQRRAAFRSKFSPAEAGAHGQKLIKAQPDLQSPNPRTLTSRIAGTKAAPPKTWSQELADEQSLQILKGGTAA